MSVRNIGPSIPVVLLALNAESQTGMWRGLFLGVVQSRREITCLLPLLAFPRCENLNHAAVTTSSQCLEEGKAVTTHLHPQLTETRSRAHHL